MSDLVPIRRAILSVSDKTDLIPFAKALAARGVEIVSTGGTARALGDSGIPVNSVEQVTGFPEIMDGRVKTLHPAIHAALLALTEDEGHQAALREHGITPIDLVCVNLYPFERTVSEPGVDTRAGVEQIDIGGPSMIRSGAKNFERVTVVTSPRQYDQVNSELDRRDGHTSRELRAELAASAFGRTAEYDAAIASFLSRRPEVAFPEILRIAYPKADDLRYGENPHQDAVLYRDPASTGPTIVNAQQLHGKPLSYNNIVDASAALELAKDLRRLDESHVGAVVVKHANACGAALAQHGAAAVGGALGGDPLAAFGGILAINRELDEETATRLCADDLFLEVICAPTFAEPARRALERRWPNARLLEVGDRAGQTARKLAYRSIPGGMLVQDRDTRTPSPEQWELAAGPAASNERLMRAGGVAAMAKHLISNAVAIGGRDSRTGVIRLFGAGAGERDRVTSCRVAVWKAGEHAEGAIAASDGFFPFPDGPELLLDAGVDLLVQPGGSRRDRETFDLCQRRGVACYVTGVRHFRH